MTLPIDQRIADLRDCLEQLKLARRDHVRHGRHLSDPYHMFVHSVQERILTVLELLTEDLLRYGGAPVRPPVPKEENKP